MYRGDLERFLERGEIPVARTHDGITYIPNLKDFEERLTADLIEPVLQEIEKMNQEKMFNRFVENFPEFR